MPEAIRLWGWQAGPDGFVLRGAAQNEPDLSKWEEDLFLLVSGGRGSGKSIAGAIRMAIYALTWPEANLIIAAPNYKTLQRGTLPALWKAFRWMGLVRDQHYQYNKTDQEIVITTNNTHIYIVSLDDPEAARSIDAAAAWIDEPRGISFIGFQGLVPTLRQPGFPHQCWLTTTPAGKTHWLYWLWFPEAAYAGGYIDQDYADAGSGKYICYFAKTRDNPHGGEAAYQRNVRIFGENTLLARQESEGEFVVLAGLTFPDFSAARHAPPVSTWPIKRPSQVVAGVDFGYFHATCISVIGVDVFGHYLVLDEWYQREPSHKAICAAAYSLMKKWDIECFFADSSAPGIIRDMRERPWDLPVRKAFKRLGSSADILSGLGFLAALIRQTLPDGLPRLLIDPARCPNLVRELENYARPLDISGKPTLDKPIHIHDDAVDAFRYGVLGTSKMPWFLPIDSTMIPTSSRR